MTVRNGVRWKKDTRRVSDDQVGISILIVALAASLPNGSEIVWGLDMLPDRAEKHSNGKTEDVLAGVLTHVRR